MPSALIIYGGLASHEPRETSDLFAGLLREAGFTVELSDSLDTLCDADALRAYDLVVPNWSVDDASDEQANGLLQAVESGVSVACWHGGLVTLRHSLIGLLIGGRFLVHPGGMIDYPVQITAPDHPVMAGISDFIMHSEQYFMLVDPANKVLATTTFGDEHIPWIAGTVMPVAWTRQWGAGRVFYSALGHNTAEFAAFPQAREIMRRGLLWACGLLA